MELILRGIFKNEIGFKEKIMEFFKLSLKILKNHLT